jgi:hypothetical protein
MIWAYVVEFFRQAIDAVSSVVPNFVLVTSLPWGLDPVLSSAFGVIYAAGSLFPFMLPVIHVILLYITYRLSKTLLEIFLIRKALGS